MDELVRRVAELVDAGQGTGQLMHLVCQEHGVDGILSMDELVTACQLIRVVLRESATSPATAGTGWLSMPERATRNFGVEISLASTLLDLAGRADKLSRAHDGTIVVTEYKSGRAFEKDGTPNPAALMQLAAYGLMVKEKYQPKSVALELIAPGQNWVAEMDLEIEGFAREQLEAMANDIPRNTPLDALELSSAGQHCWTCRVRPSCKRYAGALHGDSAANGVIISPCDIAGTVLGVGGDGNNRIISVKKNSGASARIAGVPVALYPLLAVGSKVSAFSLGLHDIKAKTSAPANFFVFRPDTPRLSAFDSLLLSPA